jgi:ankyrin repeat protein
MAELSEDYVDVLTAVQEGEFEIVQEIIGNRIVPVNSLDQSGCSLLHWAAINNRVTIARLLIENGLNKASEGGVLGETPLHWALRKKYYLMMELIFKQSQCDLAVKSVQGNDALHLACKLGKW